MVYTPYTSMRSKVFFGFGPKTRFPCHSSNVCEVWSSDENEISECLFRLNADQQLGYRLAATAMRCALRTSFSLSNA